MAEELWPAIYVATGALLGGLFPWIQATRQRKWSKEDSQLAWTREGSRELARWQRSKRDSAYEDFLSAAFTLQRDIRHRLHDLKTGKQTVAMRSVDEMQPLNEAMVRVQLYCSAEARPLAGDMWTQATKTLEIALRNDASENLELIRNLESVLAEDLVKFRDAARQDLQAPD
jgi:hypothetical protein